MTTTYASTILVACHGMVMHGRCQDCGQRIDSTVPTHDRAIVRQGDPVWCNCYTPNPCKGVCVRCKGLVRR